MNQKIKVGVLQSSFLSGTATFSEIEKSIQKIENTDVCVQQVNADLLCWNDLSNVDVLINCLGSCYPQSGWQHLLKYYHKGGILFNIGFQPFTLPYRVINDELEVLTQSAQAFHELYVIDEYESTGSINWDSYQGCVDNERYGFLQDLIDSNHLPNMKETSSIYYHFTEDWQPKDPGFAEFVDAVNIVSARAEIALACYDEAGRRMAAPISRIDHFDRGALIFLNFTPEDSNYYATDSGQKLLSGMIETTLYPQVTFRMKPNYPRYFEDEDPEIEFEFNILDHSPDFNISDWNIQFQLYCDDEKDPLVNKEQTFKLSNKKDWQSKFVLPDLSEGFYRIQASLVYGNRLIDKQSNGFYKLSQKKIQEKLSSFSPLKLDPSIAPDFLVRDGKPFPMHGTTYFVTDVFRLFLFDFNCQQCHADLSFLKSVGFNMLRTGNWYQFDRFFEEDGSIREYSLRTLEALFLIASIYNFPVQFVLSAYVFNHWDRKLSPVHDPKMRAKTVNAFAFFARHFAEWPNIQIDGLNEPSYSYLGMWQIARPTGDPEERNQFVQYLKDKYHDDIELLRDAWNVSSSRLPDFESVQMPEPDQFSRGYDMKKQPYMEHAALTDFFHFARESYSGWVREIREEIRKYDPEMLFMMGRDEPLRIPEQQTEAYHGHFDMTNWHHWHQDAVVFNEYKLNRVRGVPCCGQEIGVYHLSDPRNHLRLDEESRANLMERKLVSSFGNWIQWQSYCDPFMKWNVEISLGLFRYDKTETRYLDRVRLLTWIEEKTAPLMTRRDEDNAGILLVHPSSYYYSVDSQIAKRAVHQSILALHYYDNFQADVILEHLLTEKTLQQYPETRLIIFPAGMMVSDSAWEVMRRFAQSGGTVLFSGVLNQDEYWRFKDRLAEFNIQSEIQPVAPNENITIGKETFTVPFYECVDQVLPETAISKMMLFNHNGNTPQMHSIGKGKFIHCPLPLEIGDNLNAVAALYRFGINKAGIIHPHYQVHVELSRPHVLIYPVRYEECTCYTLVNEGPDTTVRFTDLASAALIEIIMHSGRCAKLWINTDGSLAGACLHAPLLIDGSAIHPRGDLSVFRTGEAWQMLPGKRTSELPVEIDRQVVAVHPEHLFNQMFISSSQSD